MMKIINLCETTIYLDDINVAILYSRNRLPQDIPDPVAKKSQNLKWAIKNKYIIDVTRGVPDVLPPTRDITAPAQPPEPPITQQVDPQSPFLKKQSMLVKDDHFNHVQDIRPGMALQQPPQLVPKPVIEGPSAGDIYRDTGKMNAVWTGPAADFGGYARMNRKFMFGLSENGVNLQYDMLQSLNDVDAETSKKLQKLTQVRVPKDAPKFYGMTAPLHYSWDRYKAIFTMMETRRLHKDYVIRCNCADEIIVPSRWCRDVFIESGVTKPIYVVPLGVDTKIYYPDAEPIGFSKNLKPFVFLSVFGWSLRKGYDVLLRAYLEEFSSDEPVSLLISSRYFGSTHESKKKVIRDDVAKVSSMVQNQKKPHVALFGDGLSDEMMPQLYAAADCYVLPTRGEGFGLPFLESAACKVPVIATRYSGQTDFLDDDNSYLIDVDGFRSAEMSLAWISYFYENAEFPILGTAAIEQTRHWMRYVFENQEEANQKAERLYQKVVKEYDWEVCIKTMYDKVKDIYERRLFKVD
jgi:glycosyltransferase involved in cell wall biosynthesis